MFPLSLNLCRFHCIVLRMGMSCYKYKRNRPILLNMFYGKKQEIKVLGIYGDYKIGTNLFSYSRWNNKESLFRNFSSEYVDVVIMTPLFATAEIVRSGLLLFPYVILGFIIMCIFSTFTTTISALLMSQMNLSKVK